ncbi:MAG TPA: hypothetical protein VK550_33375, partial [Polyangiaceae bacterium]|nr:hypothetical protein [Polyangiaceae bacterium]
GSRSLGEHRDRVLKPTLVGDRSLVLRAVRFVRLTKQATGAPVLGPSSLMVSHDRTYRTIGEREGT